MNSCKSFKALMSFWLKSLVGKSPKFAANNFHFLYINRRISMNFWVFSVRRFNGIIMGCHLIRLFGLCTLLVVFIEESLACVILFWRFFVEFPPRIFFLTARTQIEGSLHQKLRRCREKCRQSARKLHDWSHRRLYDNS